MALTSEGYKAELLYRVNEEVLGTSFFFQLLSGASSTAAVRRLAEGLVSTMSDLDDAFGMGVRWDGWRVNALGFGTGWVYEKHILTQTANLQATQGELLHTRINMISAEENGTRTINRNQISGIPINELNGSQVSNDLQVLWTNTLKDWAEGSIQEAGFQFFLACAKFEDSEWTFKTAERFQVAPFVGTRLDRIMNRPNTGRKKPVAEPAGIPEE